MHRVRQPRPQPQRFQPRTSRGFTLIESALATIIIGVGVLSIVAAQQAFHQKNRWSSQASIATRLGNEIREMTFNLPRHDPVTGTTVWGAESNEVSVSDYDDLDDFDGSGTGLLFSAIPDGGGVVNGPLNARRGVIANMTGWSQEIYVRHVDPFNLNTVVADGSTDMIVVEVIVTFLEAGESESKEVTRVSWLAPN